MARFTQIDENHKQFILEQKMFFVATAAPQGRVNVAPKGMDTLRVLEPDRIVWLSLTGAENETAAHLSESSRMTLMWCSFDRKPMILRVYGTASIVHPKDPGWHELSKLFPSIPGTRQIFDLHLDFVLSSCGFGVPLYDFVGERDTLRRWAERKGEEGLRIFWAEKNQFSIDGKPTAILD